MLVHSYHPQMVTWWSLEASRPSLVSISALVRSKGSYTARSCLSSSEGALRRALLSVRPFHFRGAVIGEDGRAPDKNTTLARLTQALMGRSGWVTSKSPESVVPLRVQDNMCIPRTLGNELIAERSGLARLNCQ